MSTGRTARPRAMDRIVRICATAHDERSLRIALVDEIRHSVAFDFYAWLLTDPETAVGSAPLAVVPSLGDLPRLIRAKYLTVVNRWTTLDGVATLSGATAGDRSRSLIWRELWSSYGVDDVATLVFRDQHGCWGFVDLWRTGTGSGFTADEIGYLEAIVRPITAGLRRALATTFDHPALVAERAGPVVLMLSPSLEVKAQTPDTDAYLRTLVPAEVDQRPIPAGAYNVAAQLCALEAGIDGHPAAARVHLREGAWLTLRAARAGNDTPLVDRDIAVTIEPCSPAERLTLYARTHGLTARETELLEQLTRGADTRGLAQQLHLSEHTIQDHLKSIFAKTDTHNRRTLLTRIAGQ